MSLEGKTALVTGAGRRIGQAIALALAARGARVAVHYNTSAEAARATVERIQAQGGTAFAVQADQADPDAVQRAIDQTASQLGPVAALVNSAAIFERTPFPEADIESWDRHMQVNLRGPYLFARAVAPGMREAGEGRIVNLIESAADRPWPGYLAYGVSKAGLVALTRGLARALAPRIQVNGIAPGIILPPDEWTGAQLDSALEMTPMRRKGEPEDVAETVVFLLEGPSYITGAILPVDGGRSIL